MSMFSVQCESPGDLAGCKLTEAWVRPETLHLLLVLVRLMLLVHGPAQWQDIAFLSSEE